MTITVVKATLNDLLELNEMYGKIVARMFENGVNLWNEFYPTDEFPADIVHERLYVLKKRK